MPSISGTRFQVRELQESLTTGLIAHHHEESSSSSSSSTSTVRHTVYDYPSGYTTFPLRGTFRIDHDTRPFGAMIEAPGFIGAHDVFQVQPLRFLLEVSVERLRSQLGAAPAGIVGRTLVGADENMTGECRHKWFLFA